MAKTAMRRGPKACEREDMTGSRRSDYENRNRAAKQLPWMEGRHGLQRALGRADLVDWHDDRIHLLDFKHSKSFGEEDLSGYRDQLARYTEALTIKEGRTVEAWLVALRSGEWVRVPTSFLPLRQISPNQMGYR